MARGSHGLRLAALLSAGALTLHELRYRAGYGHEAADAAAAQGHGYLSGAAAGAVLLAVAAACLFALALARPRSAVEPRSFGASWLGATAGLACVYTLQELAEGALAHGHPAGLAGVVAHGGWWAYAFAALLGAVVALALRGARAALSLTAPAPPVARTSRRPQGRFSPHADVRVPRASLIAFNLAGRAPPPAS